MIIWEQMKNIIGMVVGGNRHYIRCSTEELVQLTKRIFIDGADPNLLVNVEKVAKGSFWGTMMLRAWDGRYILSITSIAGKFDRRVEIEDSEQKISYYRDYFSIRPYRLGVQSCIQNNCVPPFQVEHEAVVYCSNCGQKYTKNEKFCENCGTNLWG